MKALVFSAGLGTRLKEETRNKPKALVEVGGKPLLQHVIEKLQREGISEIVVNVHHFPHLITGYLKSHDFGVEVKISDESTKLLETGGALKKAASLLGNSDEPILMYNVDVLSNVSISELLQEHLESGALATLVVRNRETQRYFKFNSGKRLVGWINKKTGDKRISIPEQFNDATEMAFSGIHLVNPRILSLMPKEDRFSMTDLYLNLAKEEVINGYFDPSDFWLDVGRPETLDYARKLFI